METKTEKKMDKGTKIAFGVIGSILIVVLAIVGINAAIKKKKESDGDGILPGVEEKPSWLDTIISLGTKLGPSVTSLLRGTAPAGTVWKLSSFDEKLSGKTQLVVSFASPRPKRGQLRSNDKIRIDGMGKYDGEYRVYFDKGIWYDATDNVGAVYIKTNKVTTELKGNKVPGATITKLV